jgi:exopolyphosphatase/guanosine-5'-triphosphate,3'-diphosphate pyrophosphatase
MNARPSRRVAVIDLGANTCRMIVVRSVPGYAYRLEDEIREMVRLREGMTADGLSQAAMDRAVATLKLYRRYCESSEVDETIATTTSAVRDGRNGEAFVARVRDEVGFDLRVLSGEEEAHLGVIGVLNNIVMPRGVVIDIGGGSAQISEVAAGRFSRGASLPLGALRLTEAFVGSDPISKADAAAASAEIDSQLDTLPWLEPGKPGNVAGLGGTIRNLGYMEIARRGLPLLNTHGLRVSRKSVNATIKRLSSMPLAERQLIPGLNADRADIIIPGLMVLASVMKRLGAKDLAISTNGLREGLFLEQFWAHLEYPVVADVRGFGVLNLARIYGYDERHANHVRYLALRLFDQMQPLHGYGESERQLLDAAAILHDVGTVIGYKGHHRHSATLIVNSGLPGFAVREIALVALLALYHRKGDPRVGEYGPILEGGDDIRLRRLTSILRLAEFLERGRNAVVTDVVVEWTKRKLQITLVAGDYPAVELWDADRKAAPLLQEVFGREVEIASLRSAVEGGA